MNRKTMLKRLKAGEDALELSIEKWQDIVDGEGTDNGDDNCALCETSTSKCDGCPVSKHTGKPACRNTPYVDYTRSSDEQEEKNVAIKEVEFLKSLRKGGRKQE